MGKGWIDLVMKRFGVTLSGGSIAAYTPVAQSCAFIDK
jgi:hypothetical protein